MPFKINQYSKILGIEGKVSSVELKRLYRIKAKALHPDKNPNLKSHEQFVLLHEAYEFYKRFLKTETDNKSASQPFKSKKYPKHYHTEYWNYAERMEARRKAQRRAKMRYEDFERRGYPQLLDKLFQVFDVARLIIAVALIVVLPVFLYNQEGLKGIIMAVLVQIITLPIWSKSILQYL